MMAEVARERSPHMPQSKLNTHTMKERVTINNLVSNRNVLVKRISDDEAFHLYINIDIAPIQKQQEI